MIFLKLFLTFFKIGLFTIGGGYAMLPLIQAEVLANNWLPEELLVNFIAVSESTPGPFAINIATYVGGTVAGDGLAVSLLGSACATLGVVLPSFIIIMIVAKCFEKFKESKFVKGIMTGLKPAVIGLIAAAVISIGQTALFANGLVFDYGFICSLAIFIVSGFLIFKKKMHPIAVIVISAALGIASG
ncbi:MAG: chromate transporter, partial [Clostridia bacterium]|nr:chromate transporter [Clostridia bacterium]